MYFARRDGYVRDLKDFVKRIFAIFINPNTKLKMELFIYLFCTFLNLLWKAKHKSYSQYGYFQIEL